MARFKFAGIRNDGACGASIMQRLHADISSIRRNVMARLDMITDADLLDYVEGRLPPDDRKKIAGRLAKEPALAEKCDRVRRQTLGVRALRAVLAVEGVPQEWLDLLNARKAH
jgi:hypothetical protein